MIFEEKDICMMDSNENEEKNIQDLNEIPPKDHLKTIKNHLKTIQPIAFGSKIRRILPRRI